MKSFWDKIAPVYDVSECVNKRVYVKMLSWSRSLVPKGATVLECAAGTGAVSMAVSDKASQVVCTDMSGAMLERAKRKCAAAGISNICFEERSIMALTDADETYDVVIAANVLHLMDDPQAAVKELLRTVRIGGRLLLPTFTTALPNGREKPFIRLYRLLGFSPAAQYTPQSYFEMLKGCRSGGRLKMRVIDGLLPLSYAVIEKKQD